MFRYGRTGVVSCSSLLVCHHACRSAIPVLTCSFSTIDDKKKVSVGAIANGIVFDKLVRKPEETLKNKVEYPSNSKVMGIVVKHALLSTFTFFGGTVCISLLCAHYGWISPTITAVLSDPLFFLNRVFPFLGSIGNQSIGICSSITILSSPLWISASIASSWIASKVEIKKLYKKYKQSTRESSEVLSCYGDECVQTMQRPFNNRAEQQFYDGYGGDCSYKASKS